jgi:hypothetical protein
MKKYLLIVFCLVCAFSSAQTSNLKVTLKNGPIVIGNTQKLLM